MIFFLIPQMHSECICHPLPRSVFSFVSNTSVQCSKQHVLVTFDPSHKYFNLCVREVSFLRRLYHDFGEGKLIDSRIFKGSVTTIYGQLEAFLNANDSNHARAWSLRTGGIYHHRLLTGVRTSGVRTFDKYGFFLLTHILNFIPTNKFRTFSTHC